MQKIVAVDIAVKELPYFEVFDLQWPQMTSEVRIFKSQMSIDTIRVYMPKIAPLSVFIKVWPQLAIFDLQWHLCFDLQWPPLTSEVKLK